MKHLLYLCTIKKTGMLYHHDKIEIGYSHRSSRNGSTENGTIREAKMLAVIRNRLYLCSAFETQVQNIEY